jgi:hypothetical protein
MMFFTLRTGCTRSANYIKLVASDVQPIANYYSFRWAPKIVRTLDDLRAPLYLDRVTSCRGILPLPELKPLSLLQSPLDSGESSPELFDFDGLFNVDKDQDARLEALSRKSIWYSSEVAY